MKKPILLLQFRTDKSLMHEREQIIEKTGLKKSDIVCVNVLDYEAKLPDINELDNYSAVITGASGQFNVTDWPFEIEERINELMPLFSEIVKQDKPLLAICFGHQLLAQLLGGEVESNGNQSETGTLDIVLTDTGKNSNLFSGIEPKFTVVLGHKDSVVKLPENAVLLASSDKCKYQSYRIKNNIYTTQFHPELDRDGLTWRISLYPEYMKGRTLEEVKAAYKPIPEARNVLSNFIKIVEENEGK